MTASGEPLDKEAVFHVLEAHLRRQLDETTAASRDAAAYATDEESRAESKWDTQGLEASYLAAGQASHARELAAALETLHRHRPELLAPQSTIGMGALVCCEADGMLEYYYLVPIAGGHDLQPEDGFPVTAISLQTPVGTALCGKHAGDHFRLPNGLSGRIVSVA